MQSLKNILDQWVRDGIFPAASVLVQRNGEIVCMYAAGFADQERKIPVTTEDIWVTASISKPVATAAFMQMIDRRLVRLDQHAIELLPEFHHPEIHFKHLLTHTSGLGPMEPEGHAGDILAIADQTLLFRPGTKCSYTTPAFDLIEEVVCKFSSLTWPEYTQRFLFAPLEMNHTSYKPPPEWEDRIPKVYDADNNIDPWWNSRFLRAIGLAGGGLYSTLRDLAKFGQAFLDGGTPILSAESSKEMISLQTPGLFNLEGRPQTWGLGFYLNQDGAELSGFGPLSKNSFGHGGATGTWFCVDPERKLILVQLANRLGVTLEDHTTMQNELIKTVLNDF